MDYVGKTVKKEFPGYGTFSGLVKSYTKSTGFFEIAYEDGDSEELELYELVSLLRAEAEPVAKTPRRGRPRKSPRRGRPRKSPRVDGKHGESGNYGFSSNGDGLCMNGSVKGNLGGINRCIGLGLNVIGDTVNSGIESRKKVRGFDLDSGLDDDCGGKTKRVDDAVQMVEENPNREICAFNEDMLVACSIENGDFNGSVEETSARKRRKLSNELTPDKEPVLRRSARRGTPAFSTPVRVSKEVNDESSFAVVIYGGESSEDASVPHVKLPLPPSSQFFQIDGVNILDIFSVYAFLRSFSYLLFLSPFELEDFVAAIKCNSPNSLFDFIHVSILKFLRKHLESLSQDGSQSASDCLRCLDWDLMDLITWPLFVVEYLLIHGSALRPEFDLTRMNLFECHYYNQPACVKVEILRSLCDDVVEAESILSELNRRSSVVERYGGYDRSANVRKSKKRREGVDEITGWNTDECCLCKLDGNLICCDGCPAAYHSRCVGVASDLLPEGEWYCPECSMNMDKPWMKPQRLIRGSELLGVDPHGRYYYSCCGYLLVLESCEVESPAYYYHINDLKYVIQVLKLSGIRYGSILNSISEHWDITDHSSGQNSNFYLQNQSNFSEINLKGQINGTCIPMLTGGASGDFAGKNESIAKKKGQDKVFDEASANLFTKSTETLKSNGLEIPGKSAVFTSLVPVDYLATYMNYYYFAQAASSVAEELMCKPVDTYNMDPTKSVEEIMSTQLMAISKKYSKFCWPNIPNINVHVQNENCGWCYSCQAPEDGRDCLLKINLSGTGQEGSKGEVLDLHAKRNMEGHLVNIICHILCTEDRLRGLLQGPWLDPRYSNHWRKVLLKATDVASVKKQLLTLETNLHRLALSENWFKHVDLVDSMGSASHVVKPVRVASKHGLGRKGAKHSKFDPKPTSKATPGLTLYWWRGGRISCSLFNWKVMPHFLAKKSARQSGFTKIPGVVYSDSSEFAKRNKNVAWRASVETSTSPEQLAFLVRELDSNIRWDGIENTHPISKMGVYKKSMRPFKKVVIRRKSMEGTVVKYLLEFGKRKTIPDIVVKHGSLLEESSSGRKKFWLEDTHVPLHLLKAFEEKQISRKGNKLSSRKLFDSARAKNKLSRNRGLIYLFSRADRSENYQCGHCNKVVLIREAVSCQYCEGLFHKRHAKKSAGAMISEYTCHKCREGKPVKKGKVQVQFKKKTRNSRVIQSKNNKKSSIDRQRLVQPQYKKVITDVPLRRSPRNLKIVALQKKKIGRYTKGKQVKLKNQISPKPKKVASWQKKRTKIYRSFWNRGFLLSKNPNDERVMHFGRKKLLLPSDDLTVVLESPKCILCCEAVYTSTLNYISCEICGDWFHGDAFGLDSEIMDNLIGFRCHGCLKRDPPLCPYSQGKQSDGTQLVETTMNGGAEASVGLSNAVPPTLKVYVRRKSQSDKSHRKLCLVDECPHGEDPLMVSLEVEDLDMIISKRQKTEATENPSGKVCKADIVVEFTENGVKESSAISETAHGTLNSFVEMIPILNSPEGKTLDNASALHQQSNCGIC